MDDSSQEPDEDDGDAARAFEALRVEVAALREGIERVYREGQQAAAPDYNLTLGKMEKALQAIAGRLEAVERQPAMTLTPASFGREIDSVALSVVGTASRPFVDAVQEVRGAAHDLSALAGRFRERQEQRVWITTAVVSGLFVGIGLWYGVAGWLPRSAGDAIAASLIGGGKWRAGETLMEEASPASWDKMVRLYNACGEQATQLCEAAIAVRTIPTQPEPARGPSAPTGSRALPRGGRSGQATQ